MHNNVEKKQIPRYAHNNRKRDRVENFIATALGLVYGAYPFGAAKV
ncbi:MAG: hypothetical protein UW24_C0012G0021 [Parcubacteria group bacterium GW2011_GWA2_44_12]|nr:MAG: hypothetical protein UW24_C0012G0021 [Parcubacteria group bacterium GW2011_GWA2_44_12]